MAGGFGLSSVRGYWFEGQSGYTAMAWLLECVPGVMASHIPVILGKGLTDSEVRALRATNWGHMKRVLDPVTGNPVRVMAGPWWPKPRAKSQAVGWYQNALWNPLIGPGVLASMARKGDWLLLGEDLRRWSKGLGLEDGLVRHWSVSEGGRGAGFLVRHLGGAKQEWVFLMERRFASSLLEDVVFRFLQEVSPLLTAGTESGLSLTVRLMWTTARTAEKGLTCDATTRRMREVQRLLREAQKPGRRDGHWVPPKQVKWEHGIVYHLGQPTGWKMANWEPEMPRPWKQIIPSSGALWPEVLVP
jgi:hypothetical protein